MPGVDDGQPDARLMAALAADDGSPAGRSEVWAALATARVFLPLAARRHGSAGSAADMALVLIGSTSGARALPAFADGHAVQRWRAEARPVPVTGPEACRTALDDGAQALLLDPTGAALAITGSELSEIAAGRVPVAGTGLSSRRVQGGSVSGPGPGTYGGDTPSVDALSPALAPLPDRLLTALGRALGAESEVVSARLLAGPHGPVVGLVLSAPRSDRSGSDGAGSGRAGSDGAGSDRAGADPAWLARLAERVRARLGSELPPAGLDLAVVRAEGPGQPISLFREPSTSLPGRPRTSSDRRWRRRR